MKKDTLVKTVDLDAILQTESVQTESTIVTDSEVIAESVIESPTRTISESEYDEIIREWFYRLPKGFAESPYTNEEFVVLNEVLVERGFDPLTASVMQLQLELSAIDEAEEVEESVITEAKDVISKSFLKKIAAGKKQKAFATFLSNLPGGEMQIELPKFLNSLSAKEQDEFVKKLYSVKSISQIQPADYKTGVGSKIFDLYTPGTGRGEMFLGMMVAGSKVSGGGESFDLRVGNDKYEVKDYSKGNDAIRLGTKGKVTQFPFWKQILLTLDVINDLVVSDSLRFITDAKLIKLIEYLRERDETIRRGEFNLTDLDRFTRLYEGLNEFAQSDADGYTYVTFRGPNIEPVSYTIEEIPGNLKKSVKLDLKDRGVSDSLIVDLRRLKYVRNPEDLKNDLQAAADKAVGTEIPFIIFRPDGPVITKRFQFANISMTTLYIIEPETAARIKRRKIKD
jgi:hypothetical protein